MSPLPLGLVSVGMGGYSRCITLKGIYIYIVVVPMERRKIAVTGHHQMQHSTEISPSIPVETPQIQLNKYHDAEYKSIFNNRPLPETSY